MARKTSLPALQNVSGNNSGLVRVPVDRADSLRCWVEQYFAFEVSTAANSQRVQRRDLALFVSFGLTVAVRAADLPTGSWAVNVDGNKGDLVIKEVKDGKVTGVLLGTDFTATWGLFRNFFTAECVEAPNGGHVLRIDYTSEPDMREHFLDLSRVIGFEEVVSGRSFRIYPDRRWVNPVADGTPKNPGGPFDLAWRRTSGGYLDLDTRIWFFTDYYSISPGMLSQIPGKGAKYMVAFTDGKGVPLSGGASYRLNLPPNVPAANFWSLTLYNRHHFFAPNEMGPYSVGTKNAGLKRDPDGCLTILVQADPPLADDDHPAADSLDLRQNVRR